MRWDYSLLIYFLLDIVKTCRCPSRYYLIMIAASSYRKIPQKDFFPDDPTTLKTRSWRRVLEPKEKKER